MTEDKRKSSLAFIIASGERRLSVSSIIQTEVNARALKEAELKLTKALEMLKQMEIRYDDLQRTYTVLSEHCYDCKSAAVKNCWDYALKTSPDFKAGDYSLFEQIGKGQFSVVHRCTSTKFSIKEHVAAAAGSIMLVCCDTNSDTDDEERDARDHADWTPPPATTMAGSGAYTGAACTGASSGSSGSSGSAVTVLAYPRQHAVKVICKEAVFSVEGLLRIEQELRALTVLSPHPSIVKYYECFHTVKNLYIVTERLPMDLFDFMEAYRGRVRENVVAVVVKQLLAGLAHMAAHRIAHRDLKPENVLVRVTTTAVKVCICDFGLSCELGSGPGGSFLSDFCGSPGFFAPEVLLAGKFCALKADIFSVGCIALELLTTTAYFNEQWMSAYTKLKTEHAPDFSKAIARSIANAHAQIQRKYAVDVSEFIIHSLCLQPAGRSPVAVLGACSWMDRANPSLAADALVGKEHSSKGSGVRHSGGQSSHSGQTGHSHSSQGGYAGSPVSNVPIVRAAGVPPFATTPVRGRGDRGSSGLASHEAGSAAECKSGDPNPSGAEGQQAGGFMPPLDMGSRLSAVVGSNRGPSPQREAAPRSWGALLHNSPYHQPSAINKTHHHSSPKNLKLGKSQLDKLEQQLVASAPPFHSPISTQRVNGSGSPSQRARKVFPGPSPGPLSGPELLAAGSASFLSPLHPSGSDAYLCAGGISIGPGPVRRIIWDASAAAAATAAVAGVGIDGDAAGLAGPCGLAGVGAGYTRGLLLHGAYVPPFAEPPSRTTVSALTSPATGTLHISVNLGSVQPAAAGPDPSPQDTASSDTNNDDSTVSSVSSMAPAKPHTNFSSASTEHKSSSSSSSGCIKENGREQQQGQQHGVTAGASTGPADAGVVAVSKRKLAAHHRVFPASSSTGFAVVRGEYAALMRGTLDPGDRPPLPSLTEVGLAVGHTHLSQDESHPQPPREGKLLNPSSNHRDRDDRQDDGILHATAADLREKLPLAVPAAPALALAAAAPTFVRMTEASGHGASPPGSRCLGRRPTPKPSSAGGPGGITLLQVARATAAAKQHNQPITVGAQLAAEINH